MDLKQFFDGRGARERPGITAMTYVTIIAILTAFAMPPLMRLLGVWFGYWLE